MKSLYTRFVLSLFLTFSFQGLTSLEREHLTDCETLPLPKKRHFLETTGELTVKWQEDGLHLIGNVISTKKMTHYLVHVQDQHLYFPAMNQENHFDFTVAVNKRSEIKDLLISVTPFTEQHQGYPLYCLFNTTLPLPPVEEIHKVGTGDLIMTSSHFLGILKDRCGLKPTDQVLDVGCGLGRMAYSLAYYLNPSIGSYEGFDIDLSLINRARQSLTSKCPSFHFQHVDLYNGAYNPQGTLSPTNFEFPYQDNQFDFIYLTSVFTHLLSEDVKNYLKEIKRVLKPNGKCMITMFLLNPESNALIQAGKSSFNFLYPYGDSMVVHPGIPEAAIGYDQGLFLQWINSMGLKFEALYKGSWCGRKQDYVSFQDILLITK
jgi:ubiquinone/menaquinone biosynthesis C-methylase UbiE